jgi:hypothetical protein
MGHLIKGQRTHEYRPSATRRVSGLSPLKESRENAMKLWNKLRKHIKLESNIRRKGFATSGRFVMRNSSSPKVTMWKNTPPGVYFVSTPYSRGRFKLENIYGFVPYPKKRTNAKSP